MSFPLLAIAGAAGIAAYFLSTKSEAATMTDTTDSNAPTPTLDELFQKWGDARGIDWKLIKAHAMAESSLNPGAVNEIDNESIGLMQILCRPDGNGGCSNRLNVDGWSEATRQKLLDADFNIRIGSGIIAANIQAYGLPKAIAVYNDWSMHTADQDGPFENQSYVDRVLKFYGSL